MGTFLMSPHGDIIKVARQAQSCPIQDEPGGGVSFQYKMSLERDGMLRIDNQRARSSETKPGSDRGFSKRQRRDPLRRRKSRAGLPLGGAGSAPTALSETRPQGTRLSAPLPGEDDGPEPSPGDAADRPLSGSRRGAGLDLPAAPLRATLYPRRYRVAGHRR